MSSINIRPYPTDGEEEDAYHYGKEEDAYSITIRPYPTDGEEEDADKEVDKCRV